MTSNCIDRPWRPRFEDGTVASRRIDREPRSLTVHGVPIIAVPRRGRQSISSETRFRGHGLGESRALLERRHLLSRRERRRSRSRARDGRAASCQLRMAFESDPDAVVDPAFLATTSSARVPGRSIDSRWLDAAQHLNHESTFESLPSSHSRAIRAASDSGSAGALDDKIAANTKLADSGDRLGGADLRSTPTADDESRPHERSLSPVLGETPPISSRILSGDMQWRSSSDMTQPDLGSSTDTRRKDHEVAARAIEHTAPRERRPDARGTVGTRARLVDDARQSVVLRIRPADLRPGRPLLRRHACYAESQEIAQRAQCCDTMTDEDIRSSRISVASIRSALAQFSRLEVTTLHASAVHCTSREHNPGRDPRRPPPPAHVRQAAGQGCRESAGGRGSMRSDELI